MKESIVSNDNSIIFREIFDSETGVTSRGGVPTNVTFENGVCKFPSSGTANILYNIVTKGVYSIRFRFFFDGLNSNLRCLYDTRNTSFNNGNDLYINSNSSIITVLTAENHILYVNGIVSNQVQVGWNEVVFTNSLTTFKNSRLRIGSVASGLYTSYNINYDFFEIYNRTLSPSEVKNLYDNKTNIQLPQVVSTTKKKILDVNAYNGIIKNTLSGNIINGNIVPAVINNGVLVENGVMRFPTNAYLDLGNYHPLTGDITVCGWIKIRNWSNYSYVLNNGKFYFIFNQSAKALLISNDGSITNKYAQNNSTKLGLFMFYAITRTSSGIVNIYIGNKNNSPLLNGIANQNAGNPVAGTSNINISINNIFLSLKDKLSSLTTYEGLLSLDEITQIWSSTKQYIK